VASLVECPAAPEAATALVSLAVQTLQHPIERACAPTRDSIYMPPNSPSMSTLGPLPKGHAIDTLEDMALRTSVSDTPVSDSLAMNMSSPECPETDHDIQSCIAVAAQDGHEPTHIVTAASNDSPETGCKTMEVLPQEGVSSCSRQPCHAAAAANEKVVDMRSPEARRSDAEKELQIATWGRDLQRLEQAVAEGRAADVPSSTLSLAEEILRREVAKQTAEKELEEASQCVDPCRLKAALTQGRRSGATPAKVRAAERAWQRLTSSSPAACAKQH